MPARSLPDDIFTVMDKHHQSAIELPFGIAFDIFEIVALLQQPSYFLSRFCHCCVYFPVSIIEGDLNFSVIIDEPDGNPQPEHRFVPLTLCMVCGKVFFALW